MKNLLIILFLLLPLSSCYFDLFPYKQDIPMFVKKPTVELIDSVDLLLQEQKIQFLIDSVKQRNIFVRDSILKEKYIVDSLKNIEYQKYKDSLDIAFEIERQEDIQNEKNDWNRRKKLLKGREPETYWIGMSSKQTIISLNKPNTINRTVKDSVIYESWNYTGCIRKDTRKQQDDMYWHSGYYDYWRPLILYFENNILISWEEIIK